MPQLRRTDVEFVLAQLRAQFDKTTPEDDAHLAFLGTLTLRDLVGSDSKFEQVSSDS